MAEGLASPAASGDLPSGWNGGARWRWGTLGGLRRELRRGPGSSCFETRWFFSITCFPPNRREDSELLRFLGKVRTPLGARCPHDMQTSGPYRKLQSCRRGHCPHVESCAVFRRSGLVKLRLSAMFSGLWPRTLSEAGTFQSHLCISCLEHILVQLLHLLPDIKALHVLMGSQSSDTPPGRNFSRSGIRSQDTTN